MALTLQAQKADQAVTEKVLSDIKSGQSAVLMNQGQLQVNTAAIMGEIEAMRAMMVRFTLYAHTPAVAYHRRVAPHQPSLHVPFGATIVGSVVTQAR